MKTISQVASLTGISTRTLQYYDEIDLLKPSELTPSGYRLYNDEALEKLQQILFYKELNFKLNEIKEILQKPEYDKIEAFPEAQPHRQADCAAGKTGKRRILYEF